MDNAKNILKIGCNSYKVKDAEIESCAYKIEIFDEIVIEEGISEIGYLAFRGQSRVEKVTLPSTLKSIGYEAFSGCSSLTSIAIPDGVMEIGSCAFTVVLI